MDKRFKEFSMTEKREFVETEEVREFLGKVKEIRGVSGASVTIPDSIVGMLIGEIRAQAKLLDYVYAPVVKGTSRVTVCGAAPEGIWVENTAALSELALGFSQVKMDAFKVGGYIAISNSYLKDSDIDMLGTIVSKIATGIAKAIDKAIVYGKGTSCPLGIVTRLAQTSQPAGYPADAPTWVDLHTSNISKFDSSNMTGEKFFAALGAQFAKANPDYAVKPCVWIMNRKTAVAVKSFAINFNAAGAVVSGVNGSMPVFGGDIVELSYVPDGDIVLGYAEDYMLALREGTVVESSDQPQFIQDNTVVKGLARCDGKPVIADAFVVTNINNTDPTTDIDPESV